MLYCLCTKTNNNTTILGTEHLSGNIRPTNTIAEIIHLLVYMLL